MLNDRSRELVAKHQDHENRFATMVGVFEGKLVDEIDRLSREDDAKLQETTRDLDTQFSEHLDRVAEKLVCERDQHENAMVSNTRQIMTASEQFTLQSQPMHVSC